jgi:photosystem II stability/assembly factor-like uncharacterized protein
MGRPDARWPQFVIPWVTGLLTFSTANLAVGSGPGQPLASAAANRQTAIAEALPTALPTPTRPPARAATLRERGHTVTGVIPDGAHGLLYAWADTRQGPRLLVLSADDFSVRKVAAVGASALDAERRRLYLDDVRRGLRVLDADSLQELRFIPAVTPAPTATPEAEVRSHWLNAPHGVGLAIDTVTGHVLTGRGDDIVALNPESGAIMAIYREPAPEMALAWMVADPASRLLYALWVAEGDCYHSQGTLVVFSLSRHREVARDTFCTDMGRPLLMGRQLALFHSEGRFDNAVWTFRSGKRNAVVTNWSLNPGALLYDRASDQLLTDSGSTLLALRGDDLAVVSYRELPPGTGLAGLDEVGRRLILIKDGRLSSLPIAELANPTPVPALPTVPRPTRSPVLPGTPTARTAQTQRDARIAWQELPAANRCRDHFEEYQPVLVRPGGVRELLAAALPCEPGSITLSPDFLRDGTALARWDYGLLRTTDAGRSWHPSSIGLTDRQVRDILFPPSLPDQGDIYISTVWRNAYRSTDRGQTWRPMGQLHGLAAADAPGAGLLLAGFQYPGTDVYLSTDRGATWRRTGTVTWPAEPAAEGFRIYLLERTGGSPSLLAVLATTSAMVGPFISGQGMFHSQDMGRSWSLVVPRLDECNTFDELIGPLRASDGAVTWLVDGRACDRRLLFRSDDDGASWRQLRLPADWFNAELVATDGELALVRSAEVWRSVDLGELPYLVPTARATKR